MAQLDPASILGPGGAVARRLPSYELRSQQLEMAEAVARAIDRPGHLIVEAGTGVGKSFAYLVPAILAAVEQKKKVVVSTHTIALQEQLLNKDIPFLRSVLPEEFSAVLVKGRSNYISLRRLDVALARAMGTFQQQEEFDQLGEIRLWAGRTSDGSRSDLDFRPLPSVWDAVQSENGNCLGRDCPKNKECFYFQARRRIWSANLLIVNHALFMSDLALRSAGFSLLPEYQVAIFDEAHTLEAVAGEHMGLQVSNVGVDITLARLYNHHSGKGLLAFLKLQEAMDLAHNARIAAAEFFDDVAALRMFPADHCPRATEHVPGSGQSPAFTSPTTSSRAGTFAKSAARTAYPSRVARSKGGKSRSATTRSASTRPNPASRSTVSISPGNTPTACCSTRRRASSKLTARAAGTTEEEK